MKKMDRALGRLVPPGISAGREMVAMAGGLLLAAMLSLRAPLETALRFRELTELYRLGIPVEPDWGQAHILRAMTGFPVLILLLAGLAVWHLVYFRLGSRADYLMRRLPDRLELARRCAALPLAGIGAALVISALIYLACRAYDMHRLNLALRLLRELRGE